MPATPEDFDQAEEIARWLGDEKGESVRFKKVEPGDEQILEDRAQRELDGVASFLALRADEGARGEPEARVETFPSSTPEPLCNAAAMRRHASTTATFGTSGSRRLRCSPLEP